MTLPPLPAAAYADKKHHDPVYDAIYFTKAQMREYGQQCYQAAVDKAAAYIDSRYDPCEPWLTPESFKELMK